MIYVNTKTIFELKSELLNKQVRFKSDCEFFPNFDITCKVISISINKSREIIFNVIESVKKKKLTIGSKMKNLRYEILS